MSLLASILYFAGLSVMLWACGLVFFCRRYLKYFPAHIVLLLAIKGLSLLFDLLMHAPVTPAKNLWLMLLTITHMCLPLFALLSMFRFSSANPPAQSSVPLWIVWVCASGLFLCLFRLPLVEFHNAWAVESYYPKILQSTYYPAMTGAALCYLLLSTGVLTLSWRAHHTDFGQASQSSDDGLKQRLSRLIWWSLAIGAGINLARIMQCFFVGDPGLVSLGLTTLDVFVSCGFWMAILVSLLQFAMQDIPLGEQGLLTQTVAKYHKHSVDDAHSARIKTKLAEALKNRTLVTDNTLTLTKLARVLGERHHSVSQVINRDLNSNFFELISRERIQLACELLAEQPERPIVDIYVAVGFNSKATFYKAFTRFCSMTPARFREKLLQPDTNSA